MEKSAKTPILKSNSVPEFRKLFKKLGVLEYLLNHEMKYKYLFWWQLFIMISLLFGHYFKIQYRNLGKYFFLNFYYFAMYLLKLFWDNFSFLKSIKLKWKISGYWLTGIVLPTNAIKKKLYGIILKLLKSKWFHFADKYR